MLCKDAVNCCTYIYSATDESMSMKHWLNDTGWVYRSTWTTTRPTATLSSQIPYGLACDLTRLSGERPTTAWAMAWTWSYSSGWRWKLPRLWQPTDVAEGVLDEEQGQLRWRQHVLPKNWYHPTRLHAV